MSIIESLERILDKIEEKVKSIDEDVVITKQDQDADEFIKKLLIVDKDKNVINEYEIIKEREKDPDAKIRNKPNPVFDDKNPKVKDNKDHFPIGSESQARNALARAGAFVKKGKPPKWYKGTISQFIKAVHRAVRKHYPDIKISDD